DELRRPTVPSQNCIEARQSEEQQENGADADLPNGFNRRCVGIFLKARDGFGPDQRKCAGRNAGDRHQKPKRLVHIASLTRKEPADLGESPRGRIPVTACTAWQTTGTFAAAERSE